MTQSEAPKTENSRWPRSARRQAAGKAAAALTHAACVMIILLAFVKKDSPNAASTPWDMRSLPAAEATARGERSDAVGNDEALSAQAKRGAATGKVGGETESEARKPPDARQSRLMDRLVAAYPDFLKSHEDGFIVWRDGNRTPFDDGVEKDAKARLEKADLEDQFVPPYPLGPLLDDPPKDYDPGRARNVAFFKKIYGDCKKGEVEKRLVDVVWLPKNWGKTVRITSVNGVAEKLKLVSEELDALSEDYMKYLKPVAGTYNCRAVSQTDRSSAHSYGIAIDINAKQGDYWQWGKPDRSGAYAYKNRIPWQIVAIFEKHGFIWGGKWHHFDTFHFEYRPELIAAPDAEEPAPAGLAPMPEKQIRILD